MTSAKKVRVVFSRKQIDAFIKSFYENFSDADDARALRRWIEQGIRHAQFDREFGRTPRDREDAFWWIRKARLFACELDYFYKAKGVEL